MQDYNFNLMKKTLESIQNSVRLWREVTDAMENCSKHCYEVPEEVADDMLYLIEEDLARLSFHEFEEYDLK